MTLGNHLHSMQALSVDCTALVTHHVSLYFIIACCCYYLCYVSIRILLCCIGTLLLHVCTNSQSIITIPFTILIRYYIVPNCFSFEDNFLFQFLLILNLECYCIFRKSFKYTESMERKKRVVFVRVNLPNQL